MKKIVSICLTMLLLLSCMATVVFATEETTNLLVNGTFDTDLSGWGFSTGGTTTWNEGGYATLPAESPSAFGQVVNGIAPGTTFFFESDVKVVDETQGVLVYITWLTPTNEISSTSISIDDAMDWTHISRYAVAPEGTTRLRVWFRNTNGNEQFSFDNVSLKIVDTDEYYPESANLSMETLNDNGDFPAGYKKSGNASIEKNVVFSGKNAIELSNTESGETSTVSFYLPVRSLNVEEHYELLLYYKLTDTNFTEGAENEGAKLSITDSLGRALSEYTSQENASSTQYFTKSFDAGDGWRQMMVFFRNGGFIKATVELSGVANLYIDEFVLRKASYIVNGDFQGLTGDSIPAGWKYFAETWKNFSPEATAPFLVEELSADGRTYNNYAKTEYAYSNNRQGNHYLRQNIAFVSGETVGDTYKLSADFKNTGKDKNNFGMLFSTADGLTAGSYWTTTSPDAWSNKEAYAQCATTAKVFSVTFAPRAAADPNYFDNIKMEKVVESFSFTQDGEVVTEAVSGDITASYRRPGTTFDETEPSVTMVAAVYAHEGDKTTLHSIQMLTDKAKTVTTTAAAGSYKGTEPATGYRPVMLDHTVNVPEATGGVTYSVKAMFWDAASGMHPVTQMEVLPAVAQ